MERFLVKTGGKTENAKIAVSILLSLVEKFGSRLEFVKEKKYEIAALNIHSL